MASTAPVNTPVEDDEDDEPSWTDFAVAIPTLVFAIIPFTSLWAEFANPEEVSRKYRGIARLLESVGPVTTSAVFALITVALVAIAVHKRRKWAAQH